MKEKQVNIIRTIESKTKNGVPIILQVTEVSGSESISGKSDYNRWVVETADGEWLADASDQYGDRMHGFHVGKLESPEEYMEIWENRFILPGLRPANSRAGYMLDDLYLECRTTEEELDQSMESLETVCRDGGTVHYNDEHGVGHFIYLPDSGTYEAHHFRWGAERIEELDLQGIKIFLRDFFRIGYSISPTW